MGTEQFTRRDRTRRTFRSPPRRVARRDVARDLDGFEASDSEVSESDSSGSGSHLEMCLGAESRWS